MADVPSQHCSQHLTNGESIKSNFIIESGVTVKEAQTLARHSTPDLTMNVYGRVKEERLSQTVEDVAQSLFSEP